MADSSGGLLTPESKHLPIDAGLLERFVEAEHGVEWRPVTPPPMPAQPRKSRGRASARTRTREESRLAYYHDETARIEHRTAGSDDVLTVTSGPVGALVLIGECARRGIPTTLEARDAGDLPQFPEGAIEARWGAGNRPPHHALPFGDIVKLARYALV